MVRAINEVRVDVLAIFWAVLKCVSVCGYKLVEKVYFYSK